MSVSAGGELVLATAFNYTTTGALYIYARTAGGYVPLYNYTAYGPLVGDANTAMGNGCPVTQIAPGASAGTGTACTVAVGAPTDSSQGSVYLFAVPAADYAYAVAHGASAPAAPPGYTAKIASYANPTLAALTAATHGMFPQNFVTFGDSVALSRDGSTLAVGCSSIAPSTAAVPQYGFVAIYKLAVSASAPLTVLVQQNYVSSAGALWVPAGPGAYAGLDFGATVALSGDGAVLVVGGTDPVINITTSTAPQSAAYIWAYAQAGGASPTAPYTPVPGTGSLRVPILPYITYGTGGTNYTARFQVPADQPWTPTGGASFQQGSSFYVTPVAVSAPGDVVALGEPNLAISTGLVNGGTPSTTGFAEGAALSFVLTPAYAQAFALEDEIAAACDNDYNDLVLRVGYQAQWTLQPASGPASFALALDFLRLSSSNAVGVYLVLDDALFAYASPASPYAGWAIAYYYEGARVGSTLVAGALSAEHLAGLNLAANYGATFTGAHALQLCADTAACVPSAFLADREAYYAAWYSAGAAPYAATVVLTPSIALSPSTGAAPATSSPPFVLVFACTHLDGSLGYVAPGALIADAGNPLADEIAETTGAPALLKVISDASGLFTPTAEYVPLLDVYPGPIDGAGATNADRLATGSAPLDFGTNVLDDATLRLPAIGPSAAWAAATSSWTFVAGAPPSVVL